MERITKIKSLNPFGCYHVVVGKNGDFIEQSIIQMIYETLKKTFPDMKIIVTSSDVKFLGEGSENV